MLCEHIMFSEKNPSRSNQLTNYFVNDYCSSLDDAHEKILDKVDHLHNEITQNLDLPRKITRYIEYFNLKIYLAIVTITIGGSILFLMLVNVADALNAARWNYFSNSLPLMMLSGVASALVATWICFRFATTAEGSGQPELKTVLSGTKYYGFLTMQTLWAKYFSSLAVKLSGLGMGFEGAFIHNIAILAHNLVKLPFFTDLSHEHATKALITAGITVAFVMAFGTPIGAILATIEMCSSNFQVSQLFKCFISGTLAYMIYCILHNVFKVSIIKHVSIPDYHLGEIHYFVLMGVLQGLLASAYMFGFSKYLVFKRTSAHPIFANRYYYLTLVTSIIAILTFPHNNFKYGFKSLISDLTNYNDLYDSKRAISWWYNDNRVIWELLYVLVTRFVMMLSFSTSPIPFGVFGPGILLGVVQGRLFGEIARRYLGSVTQPIIFAVAGTAAFISGMTRTFSPLVMVLEMTGELNLIFPMLVTTLFSFIVSTVFNIGFFDMLIAIRKLPYLASFMSPHKGRMEARDIAKGLENNVLRHDSTLYDIFELLVMKTELKKNEFIPMVDRETGQIQGFLSLESCLDYLKTFMIEIDSILLNRRDRMSNRLYETLKRFVHEHGQDAPIIISRKIRQYLRNITVRQDKFVMGQLANEKPKRADAHLDLQTTTSIFQLSDPRDSMARHTDRVTLAFERDTVGRMKAENQEMENRRQLVTELLSSIPIDFKDSKLSIEHFPVIVSESTKLIKVHYLFLMLGVDIIWVQSSKAVLMGKITKDDFLTFKSN